MALESSTYNGPKLTRMIPIPVIATVADVLDFFLTRTQLNVLFETAGAPGDPPAGNKIEMMRAWLRRVNNSVEDPLSVLGKILQEFMEVDEWASTQPEARERIRSVLQREGLSYVRGGHVVRSGVVTLSRSLQEIIQAHDLAAMQTEFERILNNVESDPGAAVTASCALLESLFQTYISEKGLEMPSDQSIRPLWNAVRRHLNLDPSAVQDEDLRKIVSGLGSIVDGIAALRTHRGSAHGHSQQEHNLGSRHARLTAQAAFTLAIFIFEALMQS